MSHQHRSTSPNNHIPPHSSVPVMFSAQSFHVPLSDIPPFSLGPSLYDCTRTFQDCTSSIYSGSSPGTPPPDPIPAHHQSSHSRLSIVQPFVAMIGDGQNHADSHSDNLHRTSSTHTSIIGHASISGTSKFSQVIGIVPSSASQQSPIDATAQCSNLLFKNTAKVSPVTCVCNDSSNQTQSASCKNHKCIAGQVTANEKPYVDSADYSPRIGDLGSTGGTHKAP